MKRILVREFGGPEVLRIEDADDPKPQAGQVLIRVKAAGINPYETYERAGKYGAKGKQPPFTPGSDAAGVVEAVGADVKSFKKGDRVYTTGTLTGSYAELTLCNESQVHLLPERVSFAQGAALFVPYVTAYRAIHDLAHAAGGETILVHGASGGVGIAAIQIARNAGLHVIGTAGSDQGLELIRKEGAHQAFRHGDEQIPPADIILEMLANVNLARDLSIAAMRGRVIIIGSRGNVEIAPRDLMMRDITVIGMLLWNTPPADIARICASLYAGLDNGTLRPVVGTELPLTAAAEGHRKIMEPGASGKIVLVP